MLPATPLARRAGFAGLLAAASLGALVLSPPVQAQQRQQRPAQPAQTPAQQPPAAQGGQPAGNGAAQQGQGAPSVVQVKADPNQTEWTKVCGKDQANNMEVCFTTRDFVSDQGQPVLAVAVYDVKGGPQPGKSLRVLLPVGLSLPPGIMVNIDQGAQAPGKYEVCLPNGCFASVQVKDEMFNQIKKGTTLNVKVQSQGPREVTFAVPLAGFGTAFDGAPIDPKVLEEQQKRLVEEAQRRSEELRRRLEQGQGAAAPGPAPGAPGAAPGPGAAATPPAAPAR